MDSFEQNRPPDSGNSDSARQDVIVEERRGFSGFWVIILVAALVVVCIFAFGATHRQQQTINQLNAHQSDMNATVDQLQNQLSNMTSKMNDMQSQQDAVAANAVTEANARAHAKPDPRWGKMQGQLDSQSQQLTSNQQALTTQQAAISDAQNSINQTRTDLQGSIDANHSELSGSIAKTHDELVALEQKGELNYDEFDISKGKSNRFYRVGPVSLALRKADPKHKHYDLALVVNDQQIQKKNVDLYEPVWLGDPSQPQPVEVVVNKIDKDHIHGYVASAKYSAQLQPTAAPANQAAPQTPDNSANPAPASNPQSE